MWCSTSIQDAVAVAIAGAANVTRDVRGRELLETTNGGVFAANQESSGAGDVDMWKQRCGDATNFSFCSFKGGGMWAGAFPDELLMMPTG